MKDLRTLRSILSIVLRIRLHKNPRSTIYDPTVLHLISANSSGLMHLIVGLNRNFAHGRDTHEDFYDIGGR